MSRQAEPPSSALGSIASIPRERLKALIAAGAFQHYAPLARAVLSGCAMVAIEADGSLADGETIIALPRWVVILGDDPPGMPSRGPPAFEDELLRRLAARATYGAVYSGPIDPMVYALFGLTAELGSRLIIAETQLRHHASWRAWFDLRAPTAMVLDVQPQAAGSA